jgi:hypothetical protein
VLLLSLHCLSWPEQQACQGSLPLVLLVDSLVLLQVLLVQLSGQHPLLAALLLQVLQVRPLLAAWGLQQAAAAGVPVLGWALVSRLALRRRQHWRQ